MNLDRVYMLINQTLDSYLAEGVNNSDLLTYLNKAEENFIYIYNKCLKAVNTDQLTIDDSVVKECVVDVIRDRVAFFNDAKLRSLTR